MSGTARWTVMGAAHKERPGARGYVVRHPRPSERPRRVIPGARTCPSCGCLLAPHEPCPTRHTDRSFQP